MRSYADTVASIKPFGTESMIEAAASYAPAAYRDCAWAYPVLDHGKAILRSEDALNCCLAAYGMMHAVKMVSALNHLPAAAQAEEFDVVDWGCGQGLATMCLLDILETESPGSMPRTITLADSSERLWHGACTSPSRQACLCALHPGEAVLRILRCPTCRSVEPRGGASSLEHHRRPRHRHGGHRRIHFCFRSR